MSLAWVVGGSALLSAGTAIYGANKAGKIANQGQAISADIMSKQDRYDTMLQSLMADPGSFLTNPVFTSTLDVGMKGVSRQMAAQGFKTSGNQMAALENYGQSFASDQLFKQESLLGSLSGAENAGQPASGLGAALSGTEMKTNDLNSLAGLMAFFGTSGIGGGGGFGIGSVGNNIFST